MVALVCVAVLALILLTYYYLIVPAVVLMVAILDPPREEAVEAIKVAKRAGCRVIMITGEHHEQALPASLPAACSPLAQPRTVCVPVRDAVNAA